MEAVDAAVDADPCSDCFQDAICEAGCNPVAQTGCDAGEKCTWVARSAADPRCGATACAPDGPVELGGACAVGPPGLDSGFDDCAAAGGLCMAGVCMTICSGNPETCEEGHHCLRGDAFADLGDDSSFGTCVPLAAADL